MVGVNDMTEKKINELKEDLINRRWSIDRKLKSEFSDANPTDEWLRGRYDGELELVDYMLNEYFGINPLDLDRY